MNSRTGIEWEKQEMISMVYRVGDDAGTGRGGKRSETIS